MLDVVILAAGKGTRMKSALPKVMHPIGGKPMLGHVLATARTLGARQTHVVVGHGAETIERAFAEAELTFIHQGQQLGTGHAVQQALPNIDEACQVLILYGDVPLLSAKTLGALLEKCSSESLGLLTVNMDNPFGYGRILRNDRGAVTAIVEQKDASDAQQEIREVNTGIMVVPGALLHRWLPELSNDNAQGEYYLTDIIARAAEENIAIKTAQPGSLHEVLGVNNRMQQAELERHYQRLRAEKLMTAGLTLMDPARFDCRGTLEVGRDCVVDINCVFEGEVVLGDNVSIGPNCVLKNTRVSSDTAIAANSIIEDTEVQSQCTIGPFARLRPGTVLKAGAKVGNFVETKKAIVGEGSKINHLSYIGDAELGRDVNIGAGTITCNYDGVNKHRTLIGDRVFVGSNSALVAPVNVAEDATIGAGSTITSDVKNGQLAIGRQRQRNLDGWQRPVKKR